MTESQNKYMTEKLEEIVREWIFRDLLIWDKNQTESEFYNDCKMFNLLFNR